MTLCAGTPAAGATGTATIRIATFNVMWEEDGGRAGDLALPVWAVRKAAVVDLVTRGALDVVGFQECSLEQQRDLAADLPGYTLVFHDAVNNSNPVVFRTRRFRLLASGAFVLNLRPETAGTNIGVRSSTWARLADRDGGGSFTIYNLHLDHRSRGPTRQISAVRLVARMARAPGPYVVTGDFNTAESSRTMRFLHGEIALTDDDGEAVTNPLPFVSAYRALHPAAPRAVIDHVLAGPGVAIRDAGRTPSGTASDHDLIWAELSID